ncbi:DNA-like domain protein (plasmid) [Candidatus Trichorickettsia mobilis]|uniref:DnaA N-terminal domain-containing protein n=1 Tax=Candidatus Trichorickettsia mobilis TaxID=1346319 RepID=UPI002B262D4C|nr:DnaA N-terminal domain-containing protein [Candidatus Trichorickettsia mobilis]WPY01837.1 DNA-like domain protein [Candidatus Trichorickettsia mobilis]
MLITQNHSGCNSAGGVTDNISLNGNIVPHIWYHKLTRAGGKSDTVAITILSELVFLHRYQSNSEFQLKFSYFKQKFNFGLSQVKAGIVRLEKAGLVKRDLRTVRMYGRLFTNELFLILNIVEVLKLTDQPQTKKFLFSDRNEDNGCKEISTDNIDKKYLKKKSRSNSEKNDLKKNSKQLELATHTLNTVASTNLEQSQAFSYNQNNSQITPEANASSNIHRSSAYTSITQSLGKKLAEFYPLVQDDADVLTGKSGRNFDLNFINQLMLKLASKYPDRKFFSKNSVLSYMGKILLHEIRDAVQVSNGNFRFINADEQSSKEKYLQAIEAITATDNISKLKRKIAGIFNIDLAYSLINGTNYKVDNDKLVVTTATTLDLTAHQQDLLLQQVQSVYGDHIRYLDITVLTPTATKQQTTSTTTAIFEGVWGKIRENLIDYYGSGGLGLDKSWFSKLTAEEDSMRKQLTLKAPSRFIKDWIQSNYLQLINKICLQEDYQLTGVVAI